MVAVFDEQKNIDAESQKAAASKDHTKEQGKSKGPAVKRDIFVAPDALAGTTTASTGASGKKRSGDKVEKATDDFFYEKFRKRARDSWRYQ